MANRSRLRPVLESLESRELLVGFYNGPSHSTLTVQLVGVVQGVATIGASKAHPSGPSVTISAGGKLARQGFTTVSGSLHAMGKFEVGALQLHSGRGSLTLNLTGPVLNPSSTAPTLFSYSAQGQSPGPGNFAYTPEQAYGTVDISLTPGTGREKVTLVFLSS